MGENSFCNVSSPIIKGDIEERKGEQGKDMNTCYNKIVVEDNFLEKEVFVTLRDIITHDDFKWNYQPSMVNTAEEDTNPGYFSHVIYGQNHDAPESTYWHSFEQVITKLNPIAIYHIRINLNTRMQQTYVSDFHSDTDSVIHNPEQWTTSIFYINTNNGYTEFEESGIKIESVANRMVSFPSHIKHAAAMQTDESRRIVINFNYFKKSI